MKRVAPAPIWRAMPLDSALAWRPDVGRPEWTADVLAWERMIAPSLQDGLRWVTVGAYQGRSLLFLAQEGARLGRRGWQLAGVDAALFDPASNDTFTHNHDSVLRGVPPDVVAVRLLRMLSVEAARTFAVGSLDAVFLDASHRELDVREDIAAWLPRIRPGGMLAGHDYKPLGAREEGGELFGVKAAVDAMLPGAVVVEGASVWTYRVPGG